MNKQRVMVLMAAVVSLSYSVSAREYLHPALKAKARTIRSVLVLEPQVELFRSGMKGDEGLIREANELAGRIARLIASSLREQHVSAVADTTTLSARSQADDVHDAVHRIQRKYDALAPQLHKRPKDVTKGRFSLGDEIALLPASEACDAVLFVRATGVIPTNGKFAADAARSAVTEIVTGLPSFGTVGPVLRSFISVADSRTGEILFVAAIVSEGNFLDASDLRLGRSYKRSLDRMHPPRTK